MKSSSLFCPRWLANASRLAAAICLLNFSSISAVSAQKNFNSPDAAMEALGTAVTHNQETMLQSIFGRNFRSLIPPVDTEIRDRFLDAWNTSHKVEEIDSRHARLVVGNDGWTFPIPLVKSAQGWSFDINGGVQEMRLRRIGQNELSVLQTMLAVYDAQREYALTDHDHSGLLSYASKLVSSPGKHDGLYWPTQSNEPPSPLGSAFIQARARNTKEAGYHGYHYKLMTSQGSHAPGGAYDYIVHGKLFGGFAVIAWPVRYGDTGIKSFMVSHMGQVYERDLGSDSATKAQRMSSFDPAPGWKRVQP